MKDDYSFGMDLPSFLHSFEHTRYNRPGLSSLRYRAFQYFDSRARMLYSLYLDPKLQHLSSPDASFNLALILIDSWSIIADIINFYQERIINEAYIRTATQKFSTQSLASMGGYNLKPGLAATTFLDFIVDSTQNVGTCIIPKGTKIQSTPAHGELPQIFETVETIEARADLNELKPIMTTIQDIDLKEDYVTLVLKGSNLQLREGDRLLVVKGSEVCFKTINKVDVSIEKKVTIVNAFNVIIRKQNTPKETIIPNDYIASIATAMPSVSDPGIPYGYTKIGTQEIDAMLDTLDKELVTPKEKKIGTQEIDAMLDTLDNIAIADAVGLVNRNDKDLNVMKEVNLTRQRSKSKFTKIDQLKTISDYRRFALDNNIEVDKIFSLVNNTQNITESVSSNKDGGKTQVFVFRNKASIFGHNSPPYSIIPKDLEASSYRVYNNSMNFAINRQMPYNPYFNGQTIYLDSVYPNLVNYSWVVIQDSNNNFYATQIKNMTEETASDVSFRSKVTALELNAPMEQLSKFRYLTSTIYFGSEELELAEVDIENNIAGDQITLNSAAKLNVGQYISITGKRIFDLPVPYPESEIAMISHIEYSAENTNNTILYLTEDLKYEYDRQTVTINGNVSKATHGETIEEVLGNGDATKEFQTFELGHTPLTFVSAPTKRGFNSTLEIKIDGLKWNEVKDLSLTGPTDRVFVTRHNADNGVSVIFGDGKHGMKPNTGIENVTAQYKKDGVGKSGLLRKGQLTLLKTRPLGVKNAENKVESVNGTESENMVDVKKNSAFPLLTMERIVSQSDFENFVNAFAGIGKCQASIILDRGLKTVYITIASENGTIVDKNSDLYQNLLKSISVAKDPTVRFKVDSMKLRKFNVEIKVAVSVGYPFKLIKDKIEHEIRIAFSFRSRQFGQDVTTRDIMKVAQKIDGINGILVTSLSEVGEEISRNDSLECKFAYWDRKNNKIFPSELLILNDGPEGVVIKEMI